MKQFTFSSKELGQNCNPVKKIPLHINHPTKSNAKENAKAMSSCNMLH